MSMAPGERMARLLLAVAARVVPADRRAEWRDEWQAEVWAALRAGGRSPVSFCLGAVRHALWLRRREWTADVLASDLRQAVRSVARAPGFLVVSAVTLALGVGVNAIVFSLLNGLVLRAPAGIADPDGLVQIGRGTAPAEFDNWSFPYVADLREGTADVYAGLAAWTASRTILGVGADGRTAAVHVVSGEYFEVLGVRAAAGRLLTPVDDLEARPVVVLSHALWRTAFGGDAGIVGRDLVVGGRTFTVAGVAAEGFAGTDALREPAALWVPLSLQAAVTGRSRGAVGDRANSWLWVFARRAAGVDVARSRLATEAAHERIRALHPATTQPGIIVAPGIGVRPAERAEVLRIGALLMAAVFLVLCIACANLAGLTLARGVSRRGEVAVRAALGARRGRLVRQLLAESLLVALCGAALALAITAASAAFLPALLPVPVAVDFAPDLRVLLFTAVGALAAVVLFGAGPAFAATRVEPAVALGMSGVARSGGGRTGRARQALVVVQVALAFVLLSGAALLGRSLFSALRADPGFRTANVVVVTIDARRSVPLDASAREALRQALVDRLGRLPGVIAAGNAAVLPIVEFQPNRTPLPPGASPGAGPPPPPVYTNDVDAGYFRALDLPLVAGMAFDPARPSGVVVNERFAARFFPGGDALGALLEWDGSGAATIVGIVRDAALRRIGEVPPAALYRPMSREDPGAWHILVAARRDDAALRSAVAAAIADVEPRLPLLRVAAFDRLLGGSMGTTRLAAATAATAGALALGLALIGLYGVVACAVADRRREFGLRLALGARHGDIARLVLRQGLVLAGVGLALGAGIAFAGMRTLSGLLFAVRAGDPATLAAVALLLVLMCMVACALPAVRAARTDLSRTLGA